MGVSSDSWSALGGPAGHADPVAGDAIGRSVSKRRPPGHQPPGYGVKYLRPADLPSGVDRRGRKRWGAVVGCTVSHAPCLRRLQGLGRRPVAHPSLRGHGSMPTNSLASGVARVEAAVGRSVGVDLQLRKPLSCQAQRPELPWPAARPMLRAQARSSGIRFNALYYSATNCRVGLAAGRAMSARPPT